MDYAYYNGQAQAAFHGQQFTEYTSAALQYAPASEAQEGQVRQRGNDLTQKLTVQ